MASVIEKTIRSAVGSGLSAVAGVSRMMMKAPEGDHPYLSGIHTPMTEEVTLEREALRVTGTIPPEFNGRYLRNGPNPAIPPHAASYHWFTGAGMVHGLAIEHGQASWYRNRWVRGSEACEALGETIPPGPRQPGGFDAPNTNVVGIAGRTWAIVEAGGHPVEMSRTLDTIAHNKFDATLANSYTAHPHHDPATGEYHAICYKGDVMDRVWHTVLDANGHVIREEAIAVEHGPSIHDCAITPDHVLVFDLPVTFSMSKLIGGYRFPYEWNAKHKARVGILGRNAPADSIIWCDVEPCYVFHPANAFVAEDGKIVVDVVVHDRMFARSTQGPDSEKVSFERWTIDPVAQSVTRATIDARPQEFPRYDERLTGKPYRYALTMALPDGEALMTIAATKLYRHDLVAGQTEDHDFGERQFPGEFVFVPRGAEGGETDGWYAGLVVDLANESTDFVILDAGDFTGEPVARVHLPHRIPPGFHGNWVAD